MFVTHPRARRLLLRVIAMALTIVAIELSSMVIYRVASGEWFSHARLHAVLEVAAGRQAHTFAGRREADWSRGLTLHPYLGYVFDPTSEFAQSVLPEGLENDPFGFQTASPVVCRRAPDEAIVALVGGSVAYWLSSLAGQTLIDELGRPPVFDGKRVRLIVLANGGYKQPQQLIAVAWVLALGGDLDLVVNLDGFNDCVLPVAENVAEGVFPFYPRLWPVFVSAASDLPTLALIGRLVVARDERSLAAATLSDSRLRWSATVGVLWWLRDRVWQREVKDLERDLADAMNQSTRSYARTGPPRAYADEDAMYRDLADFWRRSSLGLADLLRARGIRYFHFLQPNQYDPGSKPLTEEERRVAYLAESPYRPPIERGYAQFRAAGSELRAVGVEFFDLSRMFEADGRTLYVDSCCHLNEEGYRSLAERIVEAIRAAYR